MTQTSTAPVTTIGIDIGKNTFHFIGLDAAGEIVLRQKLSRGQLQSTDNCRRNPPRSARRIERWTNVCWRIQDLVTQMAVVGLSPNENECALIPMMARSDRGST